jgi:uncharacterized membrane protein YkvA (DUF1232 family)
MKSTSRLKLVATVASVVRASTRSGAPAVTDRLHAVPRLVRATLDGSYAGTTKRRLGLVVGAVVYVVSPLDLLPEAVLPVVGAADDAVVISWAVKTFMEETDRFLAWEAGQGRVHHTVRATSRPWQPASSRASSRASLRAATSSAGGPAGSVGLDETGAAAPRASGAGPRERLAAEMRQAATNYVLESVRKRLER